MDLKSKLDLYRESMAKKPGKPGMAEVPGVPGMAEVPGVPGVPGIGDIPRIKDGSITGVVPGSVCSSASGSFYIIESRYPLTYTYGGSKLGSVPDIDAKSLAMLGGEDFGGIAAEKLLFLDTETTGLSGGAGTVAFLVGTGFFTDGVFVIRRYFMRDYDEEPAMLDGFNAFLTGFEGLVTFNGKSFDWNLLQSRFISNRIKCFLKSPGHIDLLYPARRIWGLKLESCRLSSLEENVLGERRSGDIPGELIPSVYFRYLENGDA